VTGAGRAVRGAVAVLAALSLLVLAGCSMRQVTPVAPTARGGTLHVLVDRRVDAWDPQRIDRTEEAAFAGRTFLRTLTTQAGAGAGFLPGLVGDLATGTGSSDDDGRIWSFTIVKDAPWQDGRFVTCADVKYGVSRGFARDRLPGGPTDALELLDVPTYTDAQGKTVSAYAGPYSGRGQTFFDRAVTCDGQTITFHLKQPRYDFNQVVSTPAFAPVRQDQDTDRTNALSVFSNGPYMLEGVWKPGEGGRFVRNRKWVGFSDPVRLAWPDVIEVEEGLPTTTLVQRLIDDRGEDRNAITWTDAPAAMNDQLRTPDLAARVTRPDSGVVDVLVPSPTSPSLADARVRQAFAVATDRVAYAAAAATPMTPVTSALALNIPGRSDGFPLGATASGDPAAARAQLTSAGVTLPVPVRVTYPAGEAADRGFAALAGAWDRAGFAVTLVPWAAAGASGGSAGSGPTTAGDVDLVSVAAAWPSGSAVLPALAARVGDPARVAAAAAAAADPSLTARNSAWGALDTALVGSGQVVPLAERQRVLVRGSGVLAYQDNILLGGLPDLAVIEVSHEDPS
jgi:peptide/nickel transport system substrate-binding protein